MGVAQTQNSGFLMRCAGSRKINIVSRVGGTFLQGRGPRPLGPRPWIRPWVFRNTFHIPYILLNVFLIFVFPAREVEDENIIMYVGLIVAIAVFITVVIIIIFLLRRKTRQNGVYDYCKPLQGASTAHEKQIYSINPYQFIPKFMLFHFIIPN